ncbi:MAG TPA: helix-turn-helix domain-containing protein [Amycolatopsis sp.]|jgi:transcriptional regulator GlxA family with amidase domain|nr:helix-turn-helix domain-containing protein [Amycolatopsis sp.]
MSPARSDRVRVVVPVLDDCPLFELAVPCEVFGRDRRDLTPRWYELTLCRTTPGDARSTEDLRLAAPAGLDAIRDADLVVVPACGEVGYRPPARLLDELRRAHRRGARIAALCTGAFVLAATGLLDGREAATHWMHADELRRRHPRVRVTERALYVDEGEILTSAGTAAGIDLCLHVVRRDFGAAVAAEVGRRMVIAPHREGDQAQYARTPAPARRTGALAPVLDWAAHRLPEPLTVPQLAQRAAMSTRTFGRRFAEEVGVTPLRWLTQQRLAMARELLEATDLPVDIVAEHVGLRSGTVLRQHFHRELGTTPAAYRRTFRHPHDAGS